MDTPFADGMKKPAGARLRPTGSTIASQAERI